MTHSPQKTVCQLDENGIFIGTTLADLSPLEAEQGVYLLPANALDVPPPEPRQGVVAQWKNAKWQHVEDHRGKTVYRTDSGQAVTVEQIGELPDHLTAMPPPSDEHHWDGTHWVLSATQLQAQIEQRRAALVEQIAQKTDRLKSQILVGYPQAEIDSFYRQEREARAWMEDNQSPTPMLSAIAETRGVPLALLCQKVIEKAELVAVVVGKVIGQRQAFEDHILRADSKAELVQIEQEVSQWQLDTV